MSANLSAALDALTATWADLGAPMSARLQPGPSREEVVSVFRELGVPPSDDLVTWWAWRQAREPAAPVRVGINGYEMLSFDEAVSLTSESRQIERDVAPDGAGDRWWYDHFFPVLVDDGGGTCVLAGDKPSEFGNAPIHIHPEFPARVLARSLRDLVATWVSRMRDGSWVWLGDRWGEPR